MSRYEAIALRIAEDIRAGTLLPGERLPSLREVCAREGVSLMTALSAYRRLEMLRLISAAARSGYHVARTSAAQLERPAIRRARVLAPGRRRETILSAVLGAISDPELFPLGLGCPAGELFPLASLRRLTGKLLAREPTLWTSYSLPPGDAQLRRAIARRLSARGARVTSDEVLLTTGCMEALSLALRVLVRPGDVVAVECPTFFGIHDAVEAVGAQLLELPSHPRDGLDPDQLDRACRTHKVRAAVLMPSFANPTGSCMDDARQRALCRVLARHEVALIEDDLYAELAFDRRTPAPLFARGRDARAPVVLASSLSKTLLPGGRVGYLVAPQLWFERLVEAKRTTTLANATLPERLAAECLQSGLFDRHLRRFVPRLEAGVRSLGDAVARHFPEGTRATRPNGGFLLWLELPSRGDGERLFWSAREAGIAIVPGSVFSLSQGLERFVRLSAGTQAGLEPALARLGQLARAQLRSEGRQLHARSRP